MCWRRSRDEAARLLNIYQRRLRSNLMHALRQIAPGNARTLAGALAAMIDGLYYSARRCAVIRLAGCALDVLLHYVETSLRMRAA